MKLLTAIRAIASKALGLNIPKQQTRAASQETSQEIPIQKQEEHTSEAIQIEEISPSPVAEKQEIDVVDQDNSSGDTEKTWKEASNELKASGRPGKVVRQGESFYVEYHDHWLDEYEEKKKAHKEERLLQIQLAKEQEERKKEKIRLDKIRVEKQKIEEAKRLAQEEEQRRIVVQKEKEDRLRRERESAQIQVALERKKMKQQEGWHRREKEIAERKAAQELKRMTQQKEAKQSRVRKLLGEDVTILAQYRHPATNSEQFSELGAWVIVSNGNYSIYHESKDRVTYGKREKVVKVNSRQEAINYCDSLVSNQWYRDTRLFDVDPSTNDFPQTPVPTKEERDEARKKFKGWKEIAMQESDGN